MIVGLPKARIAPGIPGISAFKRVPPLCFRGIVSRVVTVTAGSVSLGLRLTPRGLHKLPELPYRHFVLAEIERTGNANPMNGRLVLEISEALTWIIRIITRQ